MTKLYEKNILVRIPKKCPRCASEDIIILDEISVLCGDCDWENSREFVESGNFGHLIYEYERMLTEEKQQIHRDLMFEKYIENHFAECANG